MIGTPARFLGQSLFHRMGAVAVGFAAVISLTVGLVGFFIVRHVEGRHVESALLRDLQSASTALDQAVGNVLQDLSILSHTPPIQGLVRTRQYGGIDPLDGTSTAENWADRLADIFSSFHAIRPHYLQIRYIGLSDLGREIVRVDNLETGPVRIADVDLQRKGKEPYFRVGSTLGPGEFYVGRASLNREHGDVQTPNVAVMRFIVPVFGEDGTRFGIVAINVRATPFLTEALKVSGMNRRVVVLDTIGNSFTYDPVTMSGEIFIEDASALSASLVETVTKAGKTADFTTVEGLAIARSVYGGISPGGGMLRVAVVEEASALWVDSRTASTILAVTVAMLTVGAIFASHKLTGQALVPLTALEQSNEELDNFANVASHDLKAPLRTIHNATNWIIEDMEGEIGPEMQKNIDILRSRVSRMERLLDDLLEHSRIGRKIGDTKPRRVSGAELRETIKGLVHVPDGFQISFDPDLDKITVAEMPLAQVLANLVSNAIKHHDKAAGRVSVSVLREGNVYRFSVADDGPGIAPKYHERIFRLFSTLKARDKVEGSGMGLAIVTFVTLADFALSYMNGEGQSLTITTGIEASLL